MYRPPPLLATHTTRHETNQPTTTATEQQQQQNRQRVNSTARHAQSSTTVDGIAAAIALRPQIKTIARELTGKDGRKVAKFERGGTGERIVPEDPLLKMAIAKQPNADGSGAGIIVSQG